MTDVPRIPRRGLLVVTCMDARIDPLELYDAERGDLHILRNAGGVITDDVIRSVKVSQTMLKTNKVDVVMHTDCGMRGLAAVVLADPNLDQDLAEGSFDDLEREVRSGVSRLKRARLPHRDSIRGLVFEVETGRLRPVVE